MEKLKKLFKTAGTKHGVYSVGVTAAIVAIVVVVNLIVGQLPEKYRNIDVSSTKIYEITETSKKLLKALDKDITIKVLAVEEETDERIRTFLSKYSGLSDRISVEWIDPVLHPSALEEYEATENTIVISCEETGKSTAVTFGDILVADMSSYYYTGTVSETEFDGEGQLTSAVNYVVNDEQKKIYRTAGHGEAALSATISDLMNKNNYTVAELNLLMEGGIPEDCELLLINAPTKDLSEEEKTVVENYLAQGGDVMLLLGDKNSADLENVSALMKTYGNAIDRRLHCRSAEMLSGKLFLSVSGTERSGRSGERNHIRNDTGGECPWFYLNKCVKRYDHNDSVYGEFGSGLCNDGGDTDGRLLCPGSCGNGNDPHRGRKIRCRGSRQF